MENSSLDRLAHIAHMSHEEQQGGKYVKRDMTETSRRTPRNNLHSQQNKSKKMACTCCRQQKSKCDASERHPLPCTQCARKNLVCEINASFRRKDKRAHLERIEREFIELKRTFQDPSAAEDFSRVASNLVTLAASESISTGSTPHGLPLGSAVKAVKASGPAFQDLATLPAASPDFEAFQRLSRGLQVPVQHDPVFSPPQALDIPEHVLRCEEKSVEEVVLSPRMIRDLYLEYVHHYHPILPVVDVSKGPERMHRLSPALFWVVMVVGLRRYDDDKSLLLRLSALVKSILAEISISPIARYNPTEDDEPIMNACSVYSVQAFILYSLWPPLTSSLSADSSWNTIGVALFQAIRIGLHSSNQRLLREKPKDEASALQHAMAQEQMKTWIMCNIVSQNIATAFGFPAFVQFDFLSAQYCDIPVTTRHLMDIAHFEDQVAKTLAMATNSESELAHINERVALVKVLLSQLDKLEIRLSAEFPIEDGHRKLHCLVARVHLLTYYFLDAQYLPSFELSKGLVRLYNASVALVRHVDMCETHSKDFVRYLPVVSILHVWQASCMIVKVANSPLKSVIDVEQAKETYSRAIRLVGKASVLKHDISYRAKAIMRHMWQLFSKLDEKQLAGLHLKIKSRMTASVFFDCLSLLRDKVGLEKLNIKTDLREQSSLNAAGDDDDDDAQSSSDSDEIGLPISSDEQPSTEPQTQPTHSYEGSQKTTPGSNADSSKPRKKRRLSEVQDVESKARRIIRTIPLDPQPISASNRTFRFADASASANSSPGLSIKSEQLSPATALDKNPASVVSQVVPVCPSLPNTTGMDQNLYGVGDALGNMDSNNIFSMSNDLLWKDVDSLMNDFGFHV